MFSRLIRFIVLHLVQLFYPHIAVQGREHVPDDRPIIFVLNHPNGLLDPLLLMAGIRRRVSFLAKSTFFGNPIGRLCMQAFGALPVYRQRDEGLSGGPQGDAAERNEHTFTRCRALLQRGAALALFPEGTTHSGTQLLPLRTGAARIALSAEAEADWRLGVQIVPVGLWYQNKTRFRSSALLVIGQPFGLADYAEMYNADSRQAVRSLTERIDSSLDAVVLQAENAELLNGIPVVAMWTAPQQWAPTLQQQHARAAELMRAYERLKHTDAARLEMLAQQARRYARALRMLGISDPWALELAPGHRGRVVWLLLALILTFPLAVAGFVLSYGPYRLAAPLAPRMVGRYDELISTGKLIIGSVLVLLGWLIAAGIAGALFGWLWGLALLITAPPLAYCALRWGEGWRALRDVVGYNWLHLHHRALAEQLISRRLLLAEQVMEAVRAAEQSDTAVRQVLHSEVKPH